AEGARPAALEGHAAQGAVRLRNGRDEVDGEERTRPLDGDLAVERHVLAEVLDEVPGELVLERALVGRLVGRSGDEAVGDVLGGEGASVAGGAEVLHGSRPEGRRG